MLAHYLSSSFSSSSCKFKVSLLVSLLILWPPFCLTASSHCDSGGFYIAAAAVATIFLEYFDTIHYCTAALHTLLTKLFTWCFYNFINYFGIKLDLYLFNSFSLSLSLFKLNFSDPVNFWLTPNAAWLFTWTDLKIISNIDSHYFSHQTVQLAVSLEFFKHQ